MDMETGGHDVEALANLWPVDVPFCSQYAAHILHAKGLGCVEVGSSSPHNLIRACYSM